jgi:hypothetical protein
MAIFWRDTFTEGGSNVSITAHSPDVGGTYSFLSIDAGTTATVNATTDRLIIPNADFTSVTNSSTPGSADYTITATGQKTDANGLMRLWARVSGSNGYCAEGRFSGEVRIYRVDGGAFTQIASSTGSFGGFTDYNLSFSVIGSALSFTYHDVTVNATDATYTAAGRAGVGGRAADITVVQADDSVTTSNLAGTITLDAIEPFGGIISLPAALSGTIVLDDVLASGSAGLVPGSVRTLPFSRRTGSRPLGLSGVALAVLSDDPNLARLSGATSLTQAGDGTFTFSNGALPAVGTNVVVVTREPDGRLGIERYQVQ